MRRLPLVEALTLLGGALLSLAVILAILHVDNGPPTDPHPGAASASVSPSTPPASTASAPSANDPALVAAGAKLYQADTCSACHSLDGSTGTGPTFKGLAGSQVPLSDGTTVLASHRYLKVSITAPDAATVKGFPRGVMSGAISSFALTSKPQDVRALVAYIASVK